MKVSVRVGCFLVALMAGCSRSAPSTGEQPPSAAARAGSAGMTAPGTDALRGLGCDPVSVVDMAPLLGGPERVREGEPRYVISCDVHDASAGPTCDRIVATYLRAIGGVADHRVGVRVRSSGTPKPACSRLYAPNGVDLGSF